MNIILCGICGFMGQEVIKEVEKDKNSNIVAGVDIKNSNTYATNCYNSFNEVKNINADCILDFSHHLVTKSLLKFAIEKKLPAVICTTGHTVEEREEIINASKIIPIFYSANMSVGIALLIESIKKIATLMPNAEIEIIEKHHNRKIDAPSGTALMIFNEIKNVKNKVFKVAGRNGQSVRDKNEIGIHSIRLGNIVGEHEVILTTNNETITLKHEAHSRSLFAQGALIACDFITKQTSGLYDMKDLLSSQL